MHLRRAYRHILMYTSVVRKPFRTAFYIASPCDVAHGVLEDLTASSVCEHALEDLSGSWLAVRVGACAAPLVASEYGLAMLHKRLAAPRRTPGIETS